MDEVAKEWWRKLSRRILCLICESIFEGFLGFPSLNNFIKGPDFHTGPVPLCTISLTTAGGNVAYFIRRHHFLRFGVSQIPAKLQRVSVFYCFDVSAFRFLPDTLPLETSQFSKAALLT